jgi:hypothetical protein
MMSEALCTLDKETESGASRASREARDVVFFDGMTDRDVESRPRNRNPILSFYERSLKDLVGRTRSLVGSGFLNDPWATPEPS